MWENGNNDTGLPTMRVTTQNHLLKPKTVDAGKTFYRKVRGSHNMEWRVMCLEVAWLLP